MLRLLCGRAAAGKSRIVLEEIGEAMARQKRSDTPHALLLIVPQQFALQAEQDLLERQHLAGTFEAEVLSFARLAYKVLGDTGGMKSARLDEVGRAVVLSQLLEEKRASLRALRGSSARAGFVRELSLLLSEMKQHDVSSAALRAVADREGGAFAHKLLDYADLFDAFEQRLGDGYDDAEDMLDALAAHIDESSFLLDAEVWIDGLESLTPQIQRIIAGLLRRCRTVTVALDVDPMSDGRDGGLFAVGETYRRILLALAAGAGVEAREIARCPSREEKTRWRGDALVHVEEEWFASPSRPYDGEDAPVAVEALPSPLDEVRFAAAMLLRLAREQKWRWREMALACCDQALYADLIAREFPAWGIPYFLDTKRPLLYSAVAEMALGGLDAALTMESESIIRCCKSGLMGLDEAASESLENYALATKPRASAWKKPFVKLDKVFNLDEVERARQTVVRPLVQLGETLRACRTMADAARALYRFGETIGAPVTVERWCETFRAEGRNELALEARQSWQALCETLERLGALLSDAPFEAKTFRAALEAGIGAVMLGIAPARVDEVLVADLSRSRLPEIKALLVLGCHERALPPLPNMTGAISADEKDKMASHGVYLGQRAEEMRARAVHEVYTLFAKPTRFLMLTYPSCDDEGASLAPSPLVQELKRIIPSAGRAPTQADEAAWQRFDAAGLLHAMRRARLGERVDARWGEALSFAMGGPETAALVRDAEARLCGGGESARLGKQTSAQLLTPGGRSSATRLEGYALCPFRSFVQQGLRPQPRREFSLQRLDAGAVLHRALEIYTRAVMEDGAWRTLAREKSDAIALHAFDTAMEEQVANLFENDVLLGAQLDRLRRAVMRSAWMMACQIARGRFEPSGVEMSFGAGGAYPPLEIELGDGRIIRLEGRIDRVDTWRDGQGRVALRIVDYKSYAADFSLSDAYYGLSLQLPLYMKALTTSGGMRPGGMFYFHIDEPWVDADEDATDEALEKQYTLHGFVMADADIVHAMDEGIKGRSSVIPASFDASGAVRLSESAGTPAQWAVMMDYAAQRAGEMLQRMADGEIAPHPARSGTRDVCAWCDYAALCGFDPARDPVRFLRRLGREEALERMKDKPEA